MLPYSDAWDRERGTNRFFKRKNPGETIHYSSSGGPLCLGIACTLRCGKCGLSATPQEFRNISAKEIEGCWGCVCMPAFAAVEQRIAEGEDTLWHKGVCLPFFLPYNDAWDRNQGTNTFHKRNKADEELRYTSPGGPLCFGPGCTARCGK
mmetsp:Transcript_15457/g.24056  ORF Transcript_15457/g.24056 Transcript_15457/m.24056 type:complete len:150 (-) Transcript_15457:63-512(-)